MAWHRATLDLLAAVAQSPAMLYYLDNYVSSAEGSRPTHSGINENFARELLELHTLGVDGGYDQEDIVHVARAFTGWSITGQVNHGTLEFLYRKKWHDTGPKQFLGEPIALRPAAALQEPPGEVAGEDAPPGALQAEPAELTAAVHEAAGEAGRRRSRLRRGQGREIPAQAQRH